MPDRTDIVPVRRMSVARGVLASATPLEADLVAMAKVAGILAAKQVHLLVPSALPFTATDAFCDIAATPEGIEATMTVQGFARTPLSSAALAGAASALLTMRESLGGTIHHLGIVQDVDV